MKKTKKRKLNVRLLRRIQKHILEEPRRFFMSGLLLRIKSKAQWMHEKQRSFDMASTPPSCGTTACIAGWALVLTDNEKTRANRLSKAAELLGIHPNNTGPLFLSECWPSPFSLRYANAKTPKQRVKVAVTRIDWLISHGE